jgi:hypothetical protein
MLILLSEQKKKRQMKPSQTAAMAGQPLAGSFNYLLAASNILLSKEILA